METVHFFSEATRLEDAQAGKRPALLRRAEADRLARLATGTSQFVPRSEILYMDPVSWEQSARSRRRD